MLSSKQIEQYHQEGYLVVSDIFTTAELDALEREFDGIVDRRTRAKAELDATWKGDWQKDVDVDMQLIHTHDVLAYSAQWSRFLLHDRLTETLSDLIGPNVQLHHTKLFQKPPRRGSAFPMHQDYPYFPHDRHTMMAGILHLTDATEDMGCVRVVPCSHKLGPLETVPGYSYLEPDKYPLDDAVACPASRGDVVFFNYLTIHGSGVNTSERTRKTVLIQARDPEDMPTEDRHRSMGQGMMLRGINPLTRTNKALEARGK